MLPYQPTTTALKCPQVMEHGRFKVTHFNFTVSGDECSHWPSQAMSLATYNYLNAIPDGCQGKGGVSGVNAQSVNNPLLSKGHLYILPILLPELFTT